MVRTDHGSTLPIAALFRERGRMFRVVVIYSFTWYSSNILQYLRASIRRRSSRFAEEAPERETERTESTSAADSYVGSGFAGTRGATRNLRATRLLTLSRRVP